MEIEDYIEKIINDGNIENMHKLSEILDDTMEVIQKYDEDCYKKYEMELYEMVYGKRLTDKIKTDWVRKMYPSAKWTIEQIEEIYSKYEIDIPLYSFFVIINMLYSDMSRVLGEGDDDNSLIRYIQATKGWYFDEDAINTQEAKLYNYWKYIVN